ncbi:MAG: hypothetical protein HYS81_00940 [Candidatus Aenigmatarchaeota archaeon]|nr:MAG: hypothetical protein HYS81_00940 [Candidatus Aenigmarchaeota archaeon]
MAGLTSARPILFWVIGAFLVLFGAMIGGQATPDVLGATPASFAGSVLLAFILILIGGLFWITVASSIRD